MNAFALGFQVEYNISNSFVGKLVYFSQCSDFIKNTDIKKHS